MHKDRIHLYMFRNLFVTCLVSMCAFVLSFVRFYDCGVVESLQRLFVYDIYTTLYFLLMWLCNYLIFEISKILYDAYCDRISYYFVIVLFVLSGLCLALPIHFLFQYNLCLLCILIAIRVIKQLYKKRRNIL